MDSNLTLKFVFWFSASALAYTYVGYPVLVYLLSLVRPKPVKRGEVEPEVTVIITAYNEERDIRAKLENTLEIEYPKEKLRIMVASDGSTDRTDSIVKEFADRGVELFRQEGRVGKTYTQNKAVERATGEIILFSDATTMYRPAVLREMLPAFADETVGCVAGKLIYVDPGATGVGDGAKGYWSYETFIKESESRFCSLIGASGCLYAVRRAAYQPMYPEACSDFMIATVVYKQGMRTVYEPNAVCTEETNQNAAKEFRMRVRVISQTFTDLWRNRKMMNPFHSGFYAIELVSHKLMRYAVPLFLLLALISSSVLAFSSTFFLLLVSLQVLFYAMALAAMALDGIIKIKGLPAIPMYFVLANAASAIGFYKFLRGERFANWEPIRSPKDGETETVR
jgi:cellulose synthase/poly-beta-1,6-N-acetylglucosamine synthase-like glycosyltransferase